VHPIVVFLLDGLADRAHDALGGRSGVEAAATPNLDRLCAQGSNGVLYAVGPGRAPSSEVAHWSMLGYRPDEFPGRAVFEALGRGQDVSGDDVFAYAALRPAERRDDGWWLTGRPDPERDADEAQRLVERCDDITVDGLRFSLTHAWRCASRAGRTSASPTPTRSSVRGIPCCARRPSFRTRSARHARASGGRTR
jgi:2,3-bisphosphoglycerate-independent phosphoglycerate mutase